MRSEDLSFLCRLKIVIISVPDWLSSVIGLGVFCGSAANKSEMALHFIARPLLSKLLVVLCSHRYETAGGAVWRVDLQVLEAFLGFSRSWKKAVLSGSPCPVCRPLV